MASSLSFELIEAAQDQHTSGKVSADSGVVLIDRSAALNGGSAKAKTIPPGRQFSACAQGLCPWTRTSASNSHSNGGAAKFDGLLAQLTLGGTDSHGVVGHATATNGCRIPSDDMGLASLAIAMRNRVVAPRHSGFRVVCLVLHREGARQCVEVGMNSEVCSLAGGCCAERCAISRLLMRRGGTSPLQGIDKLVIVTDASFCVLPGLVCREILAEHLDMSVPIVNAWHVDGKLQLQTKTLSELYPHPNVFRLKPRLEVVEAAECFAAKCEPVPLEHKRLYEATVAAARALVDANNVYPVHYAAGALFSSGELRVCTTALVLEYPGCIDPVARLSTWLEHHNAQGDAPRTLIVSDQWGVLHAPFAVGRSYLTEHGFTALPVLVHGATGRLTCLQCGDLAGDCGGAIVEFSDASPKSSGAVSPKPFGGS